MPTPRQLEIFVAVADAGSLSAAAEMLDVSQPSISKQLRTLEEALGGTLFVRDRGKRAQLSPLGQATLDDARRSVALHRRIAGRPPTEPPRIFVREFMLTTIKPRLDELYAAGLPNTTRFALVDDAEDIAARVEGTSGSLALVRNATIPSDRRLTIRFLREYRCSVFANAETARRVARGELKLAEVPTVVPDGRSSVGDWVHRALVDAGFDPGSARVGSPYMDMLAEQVAQGAGAAPFMDETVAALVAEGRLAPIAHCRAPAFLLLLAHRACDVELLDRCARIFADL